MNNLLIDFNLTDEQSDALQIHTTFKNFGVYTDLKKIVDNYKERIDKILIWFDADYNDNTYDVHPVIAELVIGDKVVEKIKISTWKDLEIKDWNGRQERLLSFIITPKML